ncbi:hypothetical protein [Glaciibacter superstes]|uniref:hypothetical protein n=1 Tax=Glaciibacter superstes TaxID=501023 RepID=UPI0012F74DF9|nr:hypothetical protein [Glaciibacter superstes]
MGNRRIAAIGIVVAGLTASALLSGCAASAPEPTSTPSSSESAPSATPEPTTAPTAAAALQAESCDTLISPEGHADLASSNLIPRDVYVQPYIQFLIDAGGLYCSWGNQGDVSVVVGQLAMTETDWEQRKSELLAAGFAPDDSKVAGYLTEPETDNSTGAGFVYRDGLLTYISYAGFAEFVPALAS